MDDAESLLELHSRSTLSTFGTRTSVSKLSKQVQVDDENRSPIVTNVSNEVSIQLKSFKKCNADNNYNHYRQGCFIEGHNITFDGTVGPR